MIALNLAYDKKTVKNARLLIQICAKFWFFRKGLEIVSPLHFVHDISRKIFLMLCSIDWPNLTAWLHVLLELLGNMFIGTVCFSGYGIINFEINLIVLIKTFFYMTKKLIQKINYLENEKSSEDEIKSIFHHF